MELVFLLVKKGAIQYVLVAVIRVAWVVVKSFVNIPALVIVPVLVAAQAWVAQTEVDTQILIALVVPLAKIVAVVVKIPVPGDVNNLVKAVAKKLALQHAKVLVAIPVREIVTQVAKVLVIKDVWHLVLLDAKVHALPDVHPALELV